MTPGRPCGGGRTSLAASSVGLAPEKRRDVQQFFLQTSFVQSIADRTLALHGGLVETVIIRFRRGFRTTVRRRSAHDPHRRFGVCRAVAEPGGDDRNADPVGHVRIDDGADDHGRVIRCEFLDRVADFLEFADREIHTGGHVDEDTVGACQVDVFEQRARDGRFGRFARAILARRRA